LSSLGKYSQARSEKNTSKVVFGAVSIAGIMASGFSCDLSLFASFLFLWGGLDAGDAPFRFLEEELIIANSKASA
jgi:hypothetical protein